MSYLIKKSDLKFCHQNITAKYHLPAVVDHKCVPFFINSVTITIIVNYLKIQKKCFMCND